MSTIKTAQDLLDNMEMSSLLGPLERQELYLLRIGLEPHQCPECSYLLTQVEALGYTLATMPHEVIGRGNHHYQCPKCKTELRFDVHFFGGGWNWSKKEAEGESYRVRV